VERRAGAVEMLGIEQLPRVYRGRRILVTGHTGFKGSWLTLWLAEMGARVTGIALAPPTLANHWDLLDLKIDEYRLDIRDADAVKRVVAMAQPECVFHLAAQPLVRDSYDDPLETWSTNVVGTANVLESCRGHPCVGGIVVVTSDKCYEQGDESRPHPETDPLGGHDPYSASKAAAELVAASYRSAFLNRYQQTLLATARAGNVIGGGDWARDRLIPDLARAHARGASLQVRFPGARRPWQHVLDCLAGYLQLGAHLLKGNVGAATAWNFGPDAGESHTVADLLEQLRDHWPRLRWHTSTASGHHEAQSLALDSTRARTLLGWNPRMNFKDTLAKTALWYRAYLDRGVVCTREQLGAYLKAPA
jgi:CDP-glucose 4,6-dehydratase